MHRPILLRAQGERNSRSMTTYLRCGGYAALKKALIMDSKDVIGEVKESGLIGRGGGGLPTGLKWSVVRSRQVPTKFVVCNANQGEPGNFKDRELIRIDPHLVLEGLIIAAYAVGASRAVIFVRGELAEEAGFLHTAVQEAYRKKYLGRNILRTGFDLDVIVHRGAGSYVCGEETALFESIEGRRGQPRPRPPQPAAAGLFGCPTLVNNVETLACVPHIIDRGAAWFASIGTTKSTGPKLFSVSGHVTSPGVYELPLGTTYRQIIDESCGGVRPDHRLKAFLPGGASTPVLTADEIDTPACYDAVVEAGSALGSGGIVVMDETVDVRWALENLLLFFERESCGQCTPCREGSGWALEIVRRIRLGDGRPGDVDTLHRIAENCCSGLSLCPFGESLANPIRSFLHHFGDDFRSESC